MMSPSSSEEEEVAWPPDALPANGEVGEAVMDSAAGAGATERYAADQFGQRREPAPLGWGLSWKLAFGMF